MADMKLQYLVERAQALDIDSGTPGIVPEILDLWYCIARLGEMLGVVEAVATSPDPEPQQPEVSGQLVAGSTMPEAGEDVQQAEPKRMQVAWVGVSLSDASTLALAGDTLVTPRSLGRIRGTRVDAVRFTPSAYNDMALDQRENVARAILPCIETSWRQMKVQGELVQWLDAAE